MVRTDCYMGGRFSCGSMELTWIRIEFVATDLTKRRVDKVRVTANYSTVIRRCGHYVMYSVPRKLPLFHIVVRYTKTAIF